MARNGSGTYNLPPSNPVVSGTVIESNWANETMSDLALAITQSIAYNGETVPIANLPMGGFHHTNCSDPTSRNQYATLGMVQDSRHVKVQITGGVDNLTGVLVGGATAYSAGQLVTFFAQSTNTGAMTLDFNGIGPRGLVSNSGLPLTAGQVTAGSFVMAYYDGTQFKLLSNVTATVAAQILALSTTGQSRPGGGVYSQMTIATGTSINVPAGTAWIVPPNSDSPDDAVQVSWANQTVTLTLLATSFSTTIAVNNLGQIVQFSGRAIGAALRSHAVLGVVEHITGVANSIVTKPTIFADDGYRTTDTASLMTNTIISGGLITPNGVSPMQIDISAGSIFMPGGSANTISNPNVYSIAAQASIPFRTLAGQNVVGAAVVVAPVTQYDPNGAGTIVTLPNNGDTVVHRLYYLYGNFIWVYGQRIFTSVENALSMLEWDRTQYKPSLFLMDATLVGEVIAQKSTASLSNIAQAAIVAPGGINFSIGSPGGISEAPIDGTPYGRQNAAWVRVLRDTSPAIITDATITGPSPTLNEVLSPVAAGTASLRHKSGAFNWFSIETVNPDDKTYFRSYNPANGALRYTTTHNLANGNWGFPASLSSVGNVNVGDDLVFDSVGARILGDFSTASQVARPAFQSNVLNGGTFVNTIPNGTSNGSGYRVHNSNDPDNSSWGALSVDAAVVSLTSSKFGAGLVKPLAVSTATTSFTLSETANRFQADFSNATVANRFMFQSSVANANTIVNAIPNGTAGLSMFRAYGSDNLINGVSVSLSINIPGQVAQLAVEQYGTGSYLPLSVNVGGNEALRIPSSTRELHILNATGGYCGFVFMGTTFNSTTRRITRVEAATGNLEFINGGFTGVTQILTNNGDIKCSGFVGPFVDNSGTCGAPSLRWTAVYATNGAIQTSDARMKTAVAPFTAAELAAAKSLAREIGTFRWLQSIEEKGDAARTHVGITVQRVMEVLTLHGLDPLKYAFVCYDEWDAVEDTVNCIHIAEARMATEEDDPADCEDRVMIKGREAGNSYSLRPDQLLMFIARGQEERLAAMEAKMGM